MRLAVPVSVIIRVSCPALNPVPMSVNLLNYLNFVALFDFSFGQFVGTCAT